MLTVATILLEFYTQAFNTFHLLEPLDLAPWIWTNLQYYSIMMPTIVLGLQ